MIKTLVFDFGNVVCFFDHRLVTTRLAPYGDIPAEDLHGFIFGGSLEDAYEKGQVTSEAFRQIIREKAKLRCSDELFDSSYCEIFWPNPDVWNLLPLLKTRYRLILGSNTTELHARHFCRQFEDTLKYFDGLALSFQIGARKPDPTFFKHCLKLADCSSSECIFIDDLPANVEGARACGWHGLVYTGIRDLKKSLAGLDGSP
ncbi:MAG TPA: HAD family phosphatase [Gemmataceae bacterium]|nr:HAD family phosphatase [Gemmataceae bacterium]